eukprot:3248815-Alexandrium_andersonii.AAC.1
MQHQPPLPVAPKGTVPEGAAASSWQAYGDPSQILRELDPCIATCCSKWRKSSLTSAKGWLTQ